MKLSIVLPCYNEAENLPGLVERYREVWQDLPAELILVNNGSTDRTAEVLDELLKNPNYSFASSVLVPINKGYGHGIFTGLQSAKGEFLAWSHADMQCSPEDPFKGFALLQQQSDPKKWIIKGLRAKRDAQSMLVTNVMGMLSTMVLWRKLTDINAQPKVFHRDLMHNLVAPPVGFPFDLYVLFMARKRGMQIKTFPVIFGVRAHGESKWAFSFLSRWRTIWGMIKFIFRLRFTGGKK